MIKLADMHREKFINWLNQELKKRGMKPADLASRGGISPSTISRIRNGEIALTIEACQAVSRGLGIPIEDVFIGAGVIPSKTAPSENDNDLLNQIRRLSPSQRETVKQMLSGLVSPVPPPRPPVIEQDASIVIKEELDRILRSSPKPDDVIIVIGLLDQFRLRQIFDFAVWQLRQQILAYDSSGRPAAIDWGKLLKAIDLLLECHDRPPDDRAEVKAYLLDVLADQSQVESGPTG